MIARPLALAVTPKFVEVVPITQPLAVPMAGGACSQGGGGDKQIPYQVADSFPLSQLPPMNTGPALIPFSLSSLSLLISVLPSYVEVFLPFLEV